MGVDRNGWKWMCNFLYILKYSIKLIMQRHLYVDSSENIWLTLSKHSVCLTIDWWGHVWETCFITVIYMYDYVVYSFGDCSEMKDFMYLVWIFSWSPEQATVSSPLTVVLNGLVKVTVATCCVLMTTYSFWTWNKKYTKKKKNLSLHVLCIIKVFIQHLYVVMHDTFP